MTGLWCQATRTDLDRLPDQAISLRDGREVAVLVSAIRKGDRLRIRPGEWVPVDAAVIRVQFTPELATMLGYGSITPVMAGDSLPALTPNLYGLLEVEAKTDGVPLFDRLSRDYQVFGGAALAPTSFDPALLQAVDTVVLDKTGTLTLGTPEVAEIHALQGSGLGDLELLRLVASAEIPSEHPLGKMIVDCYMNRTSRRPDPPSSFRIYPGRGIVAEVDGETIMVGSAEFLESRAISLEDAGSSHLSEQARYGETIVHAAREGEWIGYLDLADRLRPETKAVIESLENGSVRSLLLTGDAPEAARYFAKQVGITESCGRVAPRQKLELIRELQAQGRTVMMIGDGMNDAPTVRQADIGVALGRSGSDLVKMEADIILIDDDLRILIDLLI